MAEEQSTGKNFFTTLPGILTAVAGLITAIGGFLLVLNKTGCMSANKVATVEQISSKTTAEQNDENNPAEEKQGKDSAGKGNFVTYNPTSISNPTKSLTYKIEEPAIETLPDKEVLLKLKVKCVNEWDYDYNFYSKYIRVMIGEDKYAPEPGLGSPDYNGVPPKSFKLLEYSYKLPAGTKKFSVVFYDGGNEIGSSTFTLNQ